MSKKKKVVINIGRLMDNMVIVTSTNITPEQEKAIEKKVADAIERAIGRVIEATEEPVRGKQISEAFGADLTIDQAVERVVERVNAMLKESVKAIG